MNDDVVWSIDDVTTTTKSTTTTTIVTSKADTSTVLETTFITDILKETSNSKIPVSVCSFPCKKGEIMIMNTVIR